MGAPEVVQLNMNLMRIIKAKRVLDVGLFTGYSVLGAALVIPDDGIVIGIDVTDENWNATGKEIFAEFGLLSKIDVRIVPENAGNFVLGKKRNENR